MSLEMGDKGEVPGDWSHSHIGVGGECTCCHPDCKLYKKQFKRYLVLIESQKVNPHDYVIFLLAKTEVLKHDDIPTR